MLDALKTLFENDVVSAEVRQEIEEAWEAKIKENKLAVTAELREEFAQKYEHDKNVMVEAVDKMVTDRLESEMAELNEDRKQLAEAKAKYAVAMRENATMLKSFVADALAKDEYTNVLALYPIIADKMDTLYVVYYYSSFESMGDIIDRIGMSKEFQNLVSKANETGKLKSSNVVKII